MCTLKAQSDVGCCRPAAIRSRAGLSLSKVLKREGQRVSTGSFKQETRNEWEQREGEEAGGVGQKVNIGLI